MTLALIARLRERGATRRTARRLGSCAALILCSPALALADETDKPSSGSAAPTSFTARLSVINGGEPRGTTTTSGNSDTSQNVQPSDNTRSPFDQPQPNLDRGRYVFGGAQPTTTTTGEGEQGKGQPVTGDFNGDGTAEIGWFVDGQWFIDLNDNGVWDADDLWISLGHAGDQPLVGDWDGDGKADVGVFGPDTTARNSTTTATLPDAENAEPSNASTATETAARPVRLLQRGSDGAVRSDVVDYVLDFGTTGGKAVTGDFNGDGIDTIAVFRDGQWFVDVDGDGRATENDIQLQFGAPGDTPVAGDFDGDGIDTVGVYRDGKWLITGELRHEDGQNDTMILLGNGDAVPTVGDFDGDGRDEAGVYTPARGGNQQR